jgi:hypothetical protein
MFLSPDIPLISEEALNDPELMSIISQAKSLCIVSETLTKRISELLQKCYSRLDNLKGADAQLTSAWKDVHFLEEAEFRAETMEECLKNLIRPDRSSDRNTDFHNASIFSVKVKFTPGEWEGILDFASVSDAPTENLLRDILISHFRKKGILEIYDSKESDAPSETCEDKLLRDEEA